MKLTTKEMAVFALAMVGAFFWMLYELGKEIYREFKRD